MTDLEKAREIFNRTAFATERAGCVIDAAKPGYARCSMPLTSGHMNPLGVPMGGAIFTLADFAFGVASNFGRSDVFVSSSAEIHFLTSSHGSVLYAEAKKIRFGRQTCLFSVTVTDDLGANVAYATVSGFKISERKGENALDTLALSVSANAERKSILPEGEAGGIPPKEKMV